MSETSPFPRDMVERRMLREVEQDGMAFLYYRDGSEALTTFALPDGPLGPLLVGRGSAADLVLEWDERVSRVHARIERIGGDWTVDDDGLSRNGTYVNGTRLVGRRRLVDRDVVQVGRTLVVFRSPASSIEPPTVAEADTTAEVELTRAQRRVAQALCRAAVVDEVWTSPPSTNEIAAEVFLSPDAVKAHLRELYRKFAIDSLAPIRKRAELVRLLIDGGYVTRADVIDRRR